MIQRVFLLLVASLITSEALQCHFCENAASNAICMRTGRIQQCQANEDACEITVRTGNAFSKTIFKRCKQALACGNNFVQNERPAWTSSQCNRNVPSSICTCCCNTDLCNRGARCRGPRQPTCPIIGAPLNGGVNCQINNPRVPLDTVCQFTCNEGFELLGSSTSTCRLDDTTGLARFNPEAPICRRIPRCDIIADPQFGSKTCSQNGDRVDVATVCEFTCDTGYTLVGDLFSTCRQIVDTNRAEFDNEVPICRSNPQCDLIGTPPFGSKTCNPQESPRVDLGTECQFTCNPGFVLAGSDISTCRRAIGTNRVEFDNEMPICRPNPQCDLIETPRFGSKTCTQESPRVSLETVCQFTCDPGFVLVGSGISTCREVIDTNRAEFDNEVPICRPNPQCDLIGTPTLGSKACTQENPRVSPGTVCQFTCNPGFVLVGSGISTCREVIDTNRAEFDNEVPICRPNPQCDLIGTPTFGSKACTQESPRVSPGTVCQFTCNPGFVLVGSGISTCREVIDTNRAEFDNEVPICRPNPQCDLIGTPPLGTKTCTPQENPRVNPGTVCEFVCLPNHELIGSPVSTCREVVGTNRVEFDNEVPICRPVPQCQLIEDPNSGFKICGESGATVSPGTECMFQCFEGYRLEGNVISTCTRLEVNFAEFNNRVPTCTPIICPEVQPITRGNIRCTNGNLFNSVCEFTCEDSYELNPTHVTQIQCLNDTTWTFPNPCCIPLCPPHALVDLVIVLDSSSSVGQDNWDIMKSFVSDFISHFNIGPTAGRVGVFRYNKVVDTESQILLNKYPDDKQALMDAVLTIPYNGEGTRTGSAIRHARLEMLAEGNGNRPNVPDVVMIITDGRSQDAVLRQSDALRREGAITYAIGVVPPPPATLDERQLLEIGGIQENVIVAEGGFVGLDESLAVRLGDRICTAQTCEGQ